MIRFKLAGRGEGQVIEIHNAAGKTVARIFGSTDSITISSEHFHGDKTRSGPFCKSVEFSPVSAYHLGKGGKKPKTTPFLTVRFSK